MNEVMKGCPSGVRRRRRGGAGARLHGRPSGRNGSSVMSEGSGAEDLGEVVVHEHAAGVEAAADGVEAVPLRVHVLKFMCGEVVDLAPVRAAAVVAEDRLAAGEVVG